jgi:hypothetical protein
MQLSFLVISRRLCVVLSRKSCGDAYIGYKKTVKLWIS